MIELYDLVVIGFREPKFVCIMVLVTLWSVWKAIVTKNLAAGFMEVLGKSFTRGCFAHSIVSRRHLLLSPKEHPFDGFSDGLEIYNYWPGFGGKGMREVERC